ncbi:hypothetical protein DMN91_006093, partial [Ooceraea biroi]
MRLGMMTIVYVLLSQSIRIIFG